MNILHSFIAEVNEAAVPNIFGTKGNSFTYFHSHTVSQNELAKAVIVCPVFEIDLAWAHSSFHPLIAKGTPYIGHPEEFYTKMDKPFPVDNVTLAEFQTFLRDNPSIKVLIDVKDEAAFSYLEEFIKAVGATRCIVHSFIKNWTMVLSELL